jgi:hypothetical protein
VALNSSGTAAPKIDSPADQCAGMAYPPKFNQRDSALSQSCVCRTRHSAKAPGSGAGRRRFTHGDGPPFHKGLASDTDALSRRASAADCFMLVRRLQSNFQTLEIFNVAKIYSLHRGWTYKIEGLYMDLGHLDATGPGGSASVDTFALTAGPVHTHTHFTDTILRAGLNYQFH